MNEKLIVKKLLEHDDRFDQLKQEMHDLHNKVMTRLDDILTIVQRSDIERVAVNSRFDRLED